MPNFSYKALGRDGKEVRGVLQAESEAAAASRIRENYPILLSISQKKEKKRPDDGSLLEMEIGSRRIKTKKLAILCSQFAITLHSGMTVARAMRMLADQNEDKRIRKIMGAAAEEVAAGSTVASALEKYSDRFPLTFIETIRAGEQSGTLERSFDRLQKFYEKSYKTTEKIKGAMTYPLFVVAIAVVVLIIVMAKVIPTLADVFTDLGGTLPLMTRMLIAFTLNSRFHHTVFRIQLPDRSFSDPLNSIFDTWCRPASDGSVNIINHIFMCKTMFFLDKCAGLKHNVSRQLFVFRHHKVVLNNIITHLAGDVS